MAKVGATNPVTGTKMDLSFRGILGLILGGMVLWFVAATSQNLGKMVQNRLNNKYVDFTPDPLSAGQAKVVDQTVHYGLGG